MRKALVFLLIASQRQLGDGAETTETGTEDMEAEKKGRKMELTEGNVEDEEGIGVSDVRGTRATEMRHNSRPPSVLLCFCFSFISFFFSALFPIFQEDGHDCSCFHRSTPHLQP